MANIIIAVLLLIIGSLLLLKAHKRSGLSAFNIFYFGMLVFLVIGILLGFYYGEDMYLLNGDITKFNLIIPDIIQFFIIASLILLFQGRKPVTASRIEINVASKQIRLFTTVVSIIVFMFLIVLLLSIKVSKAPLLHIGDYTKFQMEIARTELYQGGIHQILNVPRYIVFYVLIPLLCFLRGMGIKVNILLLALCLFFSVLTLAKTMFVLMVVLYFSGKYARSNKISNLFTMVGVVLLGFYWIVYSTYIVDIDRSFLEIIEVFFIRLLPNPIAISAAYAEIFSFDQGLRSSVYYTYIFGGQAAPVTIIAAEIMMGVPTDSINAPAGIIGMAYPNIPDGWHWLYFAFFILFVRFGSGIIAGINNPIIKLAAIFLFGICSWFILLTDPLTAVGSYGLLYILIAASIIRIIGYSTQGK